MTRTNKLVSLHNFLIYLATIYSHNKVEGYVRIASNNKLSTGNYICDIYCLATVEVIRIVVLRKSNPTKRSIFYL